MPQKIFILFRRVNIGEKHRTTGLIVKIRNSQCRPCETAYIFSEKLSGSLYYLVQNLRRHPDRFTTGKLGCELFGQLRETSDRPLRQVYVPKAGMIPQSDAEQSALERIMVRI